MKDNIRTHQPNRQDHPIAGLTISGILLVLFTFLLVHKDIGQPVFITLVMVSVFAGLVIAVLGRFQSVDLRKMKLEMQKIEEAQIDIGVRQDQLRAIAIPLASILALSSSAEGRFGSTEFHNAKTAWYRAKLHELTVALDLTGSDAILGTKYASLFEEIDRLAESLNQLRPDEDRNSIGAINSARIKEILSGMTEDLRREAEQSEQAAKLKQAHLPGIFIGGADPKSDM